MIILIQSPLSIPTISITSGPSENKLITGRNIMEYAKIGVPQLNGQSYSYWNTKMKSFLGELGFDIWHRIVIGYIATKNPNTAAMKELKRNKKIAIYFI
jgi:hypothetical protein